MFNFEKFPVYIKAEQVYQKLGGIFEVQSGSRMGRPLHALAPPTSEFKVRRITHKLKLFNSKNIIKK